MTNPLSLKGAALFAALLVAANEMGIAIGEWPQYEALVGYVRELETKVEQSA